MKHLWRIGLLVLGMAFLTACGGSAPVIPTPLSKVDGASISDAALQDVIKTWQTNAKDGLVLGTVKAETIKEEPYQSSESLTAVVDYYNKELGTGGWTFRKRTPGLQSGFFLGAYEHGNTTLVIGAIDLTKFAGNGTYVYIVHGTK